MNAVVIVALGLVGQAGTCFKDKKNSLTSWTDSNNVFCGQFKHITHFFGPQPWGNRVLSVSRISAAVTIVKADVVKADVVKADVTVHLDDMVYVVTMVVRVSKFK